MSKRGLLNSMNPPTLLSSTLSFPPSRRTGLPILLAYNLYGVVSILMPKFYSTDFKVKFYNPFLRSSISPSKVSSFFLGSVIVRSLIYLLFLSSKLSGSPLISMNSGMRIISVFFFFPSPEDALSSGCLLLCTVIP